MKQETLDKIEKLRLKVEKRIRGNNLENQNCTLNGKELNDMIVSAFSKYNVVLIDKVKNDTKSINKSIAQGRFFNKKVPYIASMTPTVYEDGRQEIIITFEVDHKFKGMAFVDSDLNITFEFLRGELSIQDTLKYLKKNNSNFETYFRVLGEFACEYQGFAYEFGNSDKNANDIYKIDDGFISVTFDLRKPEQTRATLSKMEDLELARIKSPKYGEVYDFVEFYNQSILKSISVNEDELNPLYKKIVEKSRSEQEDKGRVLKLK